MSRLTISQGLGLAFRYALPYWKVILVTFFFMAVYAVGINGRAYLLKPFLDQVILPAENIRRGIDLQAMREVLAQEDGSSPALEADRTIDPDEERARVEAIVRSRLATLVLVGLGVVLLIPVSNLARRYLSAWVVNRMLVDLQGDLCEKFLEMPLGYHVRQQGGEVLSRLNNDVSRAATSFELLFGQLLQEPITLALGIGVMLYLNWQLTLLILIVVPPLVFSAVRFGKKIRRRSRQRQQELATLMGAMVQIFSGIKTVKAFRRESSEAERFRALNLEVFRRNLKVVRTREISHSITEFLNNAIYILFLAVGVIAIMRSAFGLSLPVLIAFMALASSLYPSVNQLARAYQKIADAMAGIERVSEILDLELSEVPDHGTREVPAVTRGLRFESVGLTYDGVRWVLEGIDLEIARGETVALVGRTGAGKTSLCDLIPRFYDPSTGSVSIDGIDLREIQRDSLLDLLAIVSQDPFLFDTTIAENIRYGRPEASREEIVGAARAAQIDEVIASLPDGYDTMVGEGGGRLSRGERQRLTVARAMIRNPSILILDEATASLDSEAEKLVNEAVERLMEGRTTIVIAHRFSTILEADKIAVLEEGRITSVGTHEELYEAGGLYRELCDLQFRAEESV